MANILQVRIDDELKEQATIVYNQLGLDLSTAVRLFLKKSVAVNGIPFELTNNNAVEKALVSVNNMTTKAKEKGISDLSLKEINKIINDSRRERKKK